MHFSWYCSRPSVSFGDHGDKCGTLWSLEGFDSLLGDFPKGVGGSGFFSGNGFYRRGLFN
jgi:hypothetical protein